MSYFALFDDVCTHRSKLYENHVESFFFSSEEIDLLNDALRKGWQKGLHAVLFADYGFGLPLMGIPSDNDGFLALHWFETCSEMDTLSWLSSFPNTPSGISTPEFSVSQSEYLNHISQIHQAISRGDVYQINYTARLHLNAFGNPVELYRRLRQPVPYAVLSNLPDSQNEDHWTLCFSPELFLHIHSDGLITTEPMKGTAPFMGDGDDEKRAKMLQEDIKNRAENVMIVDLLRNDLGKIAQIGKVSVPEPFKVSRFGSVWQMTSKIEAQALAETTPADIFRAAFPCGSITGAPKKMSMQLIEQLETEPRGLYTGSIGFLNPCPTGLGFEGVFNVVIRTLMLKKLSDGLYRGIYGVGSGIVIDSEPMSEYEECGWKANFLTQLRPEFGIFETMLVENGTCRLLNLHFKRLEHSAYSLNLPIPNDFKEQIKHQIANLKDSAYRLKVNLNPQGLSFSSSPIDRKMTCPSVTINRQILPRSHYLRRFKTTNRSQYDQALMDAEKAGAFDSLFFNSDGHLLEGSRSNVFIKYQGKWLTPALDLDILNGVMRQEILLNPKQYLNTDKIEETYITRDMLEKAEDIRLSNALRGIIQVKLIQTEAA